MYYRAIWRRQGLRLSKFIPSNANYPSNHIKLPVPYTCFGRTRTYTYLDVSTQHRCVQHLASYSATPPYNPVINVGTVCPHVIVEDCWPGPKRVLPIGKNRTERSNVSYFPAINPLPPSMSHLQLVINAPCLLDLLDSLLVREILILNMLVRQQLNRHLCWGPIPVLIHKVLAHI